MHKSSTMFLLHQIGLAHPLASFVRALHFGDHCLILMVPLPTHAPLKPVSFIFLPFFFLSFLKNFWTRRGTKLGWTLRPEAMGERRWGHMPYSLEQKWGQASLHPGMKCTYSRCVWRGRGTPCSSCWTRLERPFEMLLLRPYRCRCLPALAPCEAARGIGQARSHMREGMQHGEKRNSYWREDFGTHVFYNRIFGNTENTEENCH